MLPDIHLDQITFEEMLETAKKRIAGYYPEWTDFNYHDPGITLVELFAWLKEIQQYELDHIGEIHREKYLKLLGTRVRQQKSASAFVCAKTETPIHILKGTGLEAPGVPFETTEEQLLPGVRIQCAFGWKERKVSFFDWEQLELGHDLAFYPFGREAAAGTLFYLGFSKALPSNETINLTCWEAEETEYPRNPVQKDTLPLAAIRFTFWNGEYYQELEILKDTTFGFLFDGQLTFRVPGEMKKRQIDGEVGYFLRMELKDSQYEMPPVLRFLDVNTLKVTQKETAAVFLEAEKEISDENEPVLGISHGLCEEGKVQVYQCREEKYQRVPIKAIKSEDGIRRIWLSEVTLQEFENGTFYILVSKAEEWYAAHQILGRGSGFPNEIFFLDETTGFSEDLELLIEDPEVPECYQRWERKRDFSGSGPEDRHYIADCGKGQIRFGDSIHGMAPEGKILLVSYTRVLGSGGNVKKGKINHFTSKRLEKTEAWNPRDAVGGMDEETLSAAFVRMRKELTEARNMVTAEDYERAIQKTPGLRIESCKALVGTEEFTNQRGKNEIQLVVKPLSLEKRPRLKPALIENIRQYLEPGRMLGAHLRMLSPVYGTVSVYLEVSTRPQYQGAKEKICQAVENYIAPLRKQFGGQISYSGLYGYIDRLECVLGVRSLVLDAKGNGIRRNVYGDLLFPGNGIADEIQIHCSCSIDE